MSTSDVEAAIRHERDYIERTIATVRIHGGADNSWPQWANIFADEIEACWAELERERTRGIDHSVYEMVCEERDRLEAELVAAREQLQHAEAIIRSDVALDSAISVAEGYKAELAAARELETALRVELRDNRVRLRNVLRRSLRFRERERLLREALREIYLYTKPLSWEDGRFNVIRDTARTALDAAGEQAAKVWGPERMRHDPERS